MDINVLHGGTFYLLVGTLFLLLTTLFTLNVGVIIQIYWVQKRLGDIEKRIEELGEKKG